MEVVSFRWCVRDEDRLHLTMLHWEEVIVAPSGCLVQTSEGCICAATHFPVGDFLICNESAPSVQHTRQSCVHI